MVRTGLVGGVRGKRQCNLIWFLYSKIVTFESQANVR